MIGEKRRKRRMTHELLRTMRKNGAGRHHIVPGLSKEKCAGAAGGSDSKTKAENQKVLDWFRRSGGNSSGSCFGACGAVSAERSSHGGFPESKWLYCLFPLRRAGSIRH